MPSHPSLLASQPAQAQHTRHPLQLGPPRNHPILNRAIRLFYFTTGISHLRCPGCIKHRLTGGSSTLSPSFVHVKPIQHDTHYYSQWLYSGYKKRLHGTGETLKRQTLSDRPKDPLKLSFSTGVRLRSHTRYTHGQHTTLIGYCS